MSSISIVIPVYNNSHFTQACINDLKKLSNKNIDICFVNNGSTDNTQSVLNDIESKDDRFWYKYNIENEYFAKACNKGFNSAIGEYVLFFNNDIRVQNNHEDWINALVEAASDGSIVGPTGGILDNDFHFVRHTDKIEPGNFYISAWCIMAKKTTWQKLIEPGEIGPFNSEFGLFFEDGHASLMARKLGIPLKIVFVPVMHIGHATAKKLDMNKLYMNAHKKFKEKWKNTPVI